MGALYRAHFVEGRETAVAIRAADRAILTSRRAKRESRHPFHWASFVAVERE
jgi:CHAT domain-containing protein